MKTLLGIDEGTSAVKAQLFDLNLRPIAQARVDKETRQPKDGLVEQDPDEIIDAVVAVVDELISTNPTAEIVACGLDHQGESILAWDSDTRRALTPVITWQDKRSQAILDDLSPEDRDTVSQTTQLPLDPYFSAGKISWLIKSGLPSGAQFGTVDSWISVRLGGTFTTDRSTASRTQLVRPGDDEWDLQVCRIFGIDPAALPTITDSIGSLGHLFHPSWNREIPITARVVDQQAALAGSGAVMPGTVKATFGTGVFVLAFLGNTLPEGIAKAGLVPTVAWSVNGIPSYAAEGGVFSAGSLLEWMCGRLGLFESPRGIIELAENVAGTAGVRVLPALAGLGAPWWNSDARGVISGLTDAARPEHIARATLEGIVHSVCDVLDAFLTFTPITELRIDGGLTRSDIVAQLQADLANLRVERREADTTSLGAAALAAVGAGIWPDISDIAHHLGPAESFSPADTADRSQKRSEWRRFVERASSL